MGRLPNREKPVRKKYYRGKTQGQLFTYVWLASQVFYAIAIKETGCRCQNYMPSISRKPCDTDTDTYTGTDTDTDTDTGTDTDTDTGTDTDPKFP